MLSVIIATYNRSEDLKIVLDCLQRQERADQLDYEVLIVDNNSKDGTRAVVEAFIPSFQGKLRYYFEPQQGKSYAMNQGLKEARGDIIVLTDDDCSFENDYMMKIQKTFEEVGPSIGFIGGRIFPRWVDCSMPEWFDHATIEGFEDTFWGPLAILDYGDKPFTINKQYVDRVGTKLFYGANMAVRKELFIKYGGFNTDKVVAEDMEFQLRFLKYEALGYYAPQIQVLHKVTPQRLEPEYYYRWYYTQGIYREILENFKPKFFYPLGIRTLFIFKTVQMWMGSLFPSF